MPLHLGGRSTKAGARTPATPAVVAQALDDPRRSTKAGARTPATPPAESADRRRRDRSTKAGARTPATPADAGRRGGHASPLNEGRGANPGDTMRRRMWPVYCRSAQRRPGREPRRHSSTSPAYSRSSHAQRRPGREPRRHASSPTAPWGRSRALNEGRGANPGDTSCSQSSASAAACAQRRPGREPRRHARSTTIRRRGPAAPLNEGRGANPGDTRHRCSGSARCRRSTKAGARTPATPGSLSREAARQRVAQRRPGREPRRHLPVDRLAASPPAAAQRRPGREPRRHPAVRSEIHFAAPSAQRRPGREPRRHSKSGLPTRGGLAAQRRPGREPRRHVQDPGSTFASRSRSTKAGARTPATPGCTCWRARRRCPLNEGRGANPGDTTPPTNPASTATHAQRRPGREPRRHQPHQVAADAGLDRSTKAGAPTPATRDRALFGPGSGARSTKAGARTPATRPRPA